MRSICRFARRRRVRRGVPTAASWPPFRKAGDIWGIDFPVPPVRSANWPVRLGPRPR